MLRACAENGLENNTAATSASKAPAHCDRLPINLINMTKAPLLNNISAQFVDISVIYPFKKHRFLTAAGKTIDIKNRITGNIIKYLSGPDTARLDGRIRFSITEDTITPPHAPENAQKIP